ncbi:MAG: HAD-IIA family hydrolase [Bacillota bacterium]|nr:HAD-IIA family hydrolase [Bacillota bacterium]
MTNDLNKFSTLRFFMLDMDGTIYLGDELLPGAMEFLNQVKKQGKKYIFLTNNSSRNKKTYVEKLNRLGIKATTEDVFTSGDATIIYLKRQKKNPSVYLLGTPDLEESFEKEGIKLVKGRGGKPDFVVLGFDQTLTYEKIWVACDYLREGVPFVATHPDFNCPLPGDKFMPDTGAMIEMFKAATGVAPLVIGKPTKGMVDSVIDKYGVKREEIAMVGDRLYTDIAIGANAGISSILVLSGETSEKEYNEQNKFKASFVFGGVGDMVPIL